MSRSPAVSVVIAVHDGERFLPEALDSVIAQTLSDFELLVVDDGSTDATPQILEAYAADDRRLVVVHQENRGRALALNRGIELAQAELIARLDADDVMISTRLERQHRFLTENERVGVVGGAVSFINDAGRVFAEHRYPLTDAEIRETLPRTTPFVHPAVTMRKTAFHEAGGYRPMFRDADDVDLWLRLAERHELANLPDVVVRYRFHGHQASVRSFEEQSVCAIAARAAARARAGGDPDPIAEVTRIDRQVLLEHGISAEQITETMVHDAMWLGRNLGRAGYQAAQADMFSRAADWARSDGGSRVLLAYVHRQRARRYDEQGSPLRAHLMRARAVLARRGA